jgi:hypothetical protein
MPPDHEVAVEVQPHEGGFRYRAMIYNTRPRYIEETAAGLDPPIRAKLLHSGDWLNTYTEAMAYARGWFARRL